MIMKNLKRNRLWVVRQMVFLIVLSLGHSKIMAKLWLNSRMTKMNKSPWKADHHLFQMPRTSINSDTESKKRSSKKKKPKTENKELTGPTDKMYVLIRSRIMFWGYLHRSIAIISKISSISFLWCSLNRTNKKTSKSSESSLNYSIRTRMATSIIRICWLLLRVIFIRDSKILWISSPIFRDKTPAMVSRSKDHSPIPYLSANLSPSFGL